MKKTLLVILGIGFVLCFIGCSRSISFNEAKTFMKNRCINIEQSYIDGKSISLDNTRLYIFLTKSTKYPNRYCVITINENKLEVLKADCGKSEKRAQFYSI
jgi:hypothetical protein